MPSRIARKPFAASYLNFSTRQDFKAKQTGRRGVPDRSNVKVLGGNLFRVTRRIDTPIAAAYISFGPWMSSTPFGEHLRREREMRGVSLDEISAATRISTRFLDALENERWEELPGGAFNRGFIRSVARFLGIDEDGLVAEYAFERKTADDARIAVAQSQEIPRNWQPILASVLVIAVLIAGGVFAYRHYGARIAERFHRHAPTSAENNATTASATPDQTSAGSATPNAADPPAASTPAPVVPDLALTIQAMKTADLTVVADGKNVFAGILHSKDTQHFEAHNTLEIDSSHPSDFSLALNGHDVTWVAAPGEPGKMTLARSDLPPATEPAH